MIYNLIYDSPKKNITELVINRSAILHHFPEGRQLEDSIAVFKEIYDYRSKLLHGTISPWDGKIPSIAEKAGEATRLVLLTGFNFYSAMYQKDPTPSLRKLKNAFHEEERKYSL